MNLEIHKSNRARGKFHHKAPRGINSKETKSIVMKEITEYIHQNGDFGNVNYLAYESQITTKLDPHTTYRYEDLY